MEQFPRIDARSEGRRRISGQGSWPTRYRRSYCFVETIGLDERTSLNGDVIMAFLIYGRRYPSTEEQSQQGDMYGFLSTQHKEYDENSPLNVSPVGHLLPMD